ncbi:uncharacterized protein LY89DRAFT_776308 [Mollisia scopiformis]|uniref:Uncharacterized protein n=1 Tax=Mollisia scopiformis TaxID=149040 RepID=A0A194XVU4_MOLSC|nr:uncharacterized protein LY89DRAFT_776308 [Mollisia scopiformis]KUJ24134.1 hypothetical protein LY89DRAFT_776308 [Mollisia scopiformis]
MPDSAGLEKPSPELGGWLGPDPEPAPEAGWRRGPALQVATALIALVCCQLLMGQCLLTPANHLTGLPIDGAAEKNIGLALVCGFAQLIAVFSYLSPSAWTDHDHGSDFYKPILWSCAIIAVLAFCSYALLSLPLSFGYAPDFAAYWIFTTWPLILHLFFSRVAFVLVAFWHSPYIETVDEAIARGQDGREKRVSRAGPSFAEYPDLSRTAAISRKNLRFAKSLITMKLFILYTTQGMLHHVWLPHFLDQETNKFSCFFVVMSTVCFLLQIEVMISIHGTLLVFKIFSKGSLLFHLAYVTFSMAIFCQHLMVPTWWSCWVVSSYVAILMVTILGLRFVVSDDWVTECRDARVLWDLLKALRETRGRDLEGGGEYVVPGDDAAERWVKFGPAWMIMGQRT